MPVQSPEHLISGYAPRPWPPRVAAEKSAAALFGVATDAGSSSLVSLCEFRLRTAETIPADADEGYEPMATVIREVGRELAADGLLVAWHAEGREPTTLFASGACEPRSAAEGDMLAAARRAAADGASPVRWASPAPDADAAALLTTRVQAGGGVVTITAFFRRIGESARTGARDAATRLLPMAQGFFRLWALRARAVALSRGLTAALNSSDVATLLVDAASRVVFANAAAERLLGRNDGLRRAGSLLSGTSLADTIKLQASIEHVAHGGEPGIVASPVVPLRRDAGRPLLAAIMPADRAANAAATVHVFDPDQDLEPLLAPVCRLYGLSPVEGRLASLLARGVGLADAAKAMRVQEQTARSYLKQVFLKTDTNRQAELVWLMLKSAVRTGPGCPTRLV